MLLGKDQSSPSMFFTARCWLNILWVLIWFTWTFTLIRGIVPSINWWIFLVRGRIYFFQWRRRFCPLKVNNIYIGWATWNCCWTSRINHCIWIWSVHTTITSYWANFDCAIHFQMSWSSNWHFFTSVIWKGLFRRIISHICGCYIWIGLYITRSTLRYLFRIILADCIFILFHFVNFIKSIAKHQYITYLY